VSLPAEVAMSTLQESLDLIARGAEEILKLEELETRLKSGKTLRSAYRSYRADQQDAPVSDARPSGDLPDR
jgi:hypothetical protein